MTTTMSTMMSKINRNPRFAKGARIQPKWRRIRFFTAITVATITLLSATVVFGQASQQFDLACRGLLTAGAGVSTGGDFAVTAAVGVPIVPLKDSETNPTYAIRSADFGLRAGFLPGYPTGVVAATDQAVTPANVDQNFFQRLPTIHKALFIIRGGC